MAKPKRHWRKFPPIFIDLLLEAAQSREPELKGATPQTAFNMRIEFYRFRDALFDDPERTPGSEADELHKLAIDYVTETRNEPDGTVTFRLVLHPLVAGRRSGQLVFGKQAAITTGEP